MAHLEHLAFDARITSDRKKHVRSLDPIQYDTIIAMTLFVATLLTKDFYIPKGCLLI
jgi:hypothetical protein